MHWEQWKVVIAQVWCLFVCQHIAYITSISWKRHTHLLSHIPLLDTTLQTHPTLTFRWAKCINGYHFIFKKFHDAWVRSVQFLDLVIYKGKRFQKTGTPYIKMPYKEEKTQDDSCTDLHATHDPSLTASL